MAVEIQVSQPFNTVFTAIYQPAASPERFAASCKTQPQGLFSLP